MFSGVFKSGPLVHTSNMTVPKFLVLHVPMSLAKECRVFPEPILGMPELTCARLLTASCHLS